MARYSVPVYWQMCGYMEVEADSPEEAILMAEEQGVYRAFPDSAEYVADSFHADRDEEPVLLD